MGYFEKTPEEKKQEEIESAKFALVMCAIIIGIWLMISGLNAIKEGMTFKQWLHSLRGQEVKTEADKNKAVPTAAAKVSTAIATTS